MDRVYIHTCALFPTHRRLCTLQNRHSFSPPSRTFALTRFQPFPLASSYQDVLTARERIDPLFANFSWLGVKFGYFNRKADPVTVDIYTGRSQEHHIDHHLYKLELRSQNRVTKFYIVFGSAYIPHSQWLIINHCWRRVRNTRTVKTFRDWAETWETNFSFCNISRWKVTDIVFFFNLRW